MNRAFCVATVWPSDFLLVGKDCSSGFGISNWKQVAWAAICLFNHLPHSMHSCQMTKVRLLQSAKTIFANNYFLSCFIFEELSPTWLKIFVSLKVPQMEYPAALQMSLSLSIIYIILVSRHQVKLCPHLLSFNHRDFSVAAIEDGIWPIVFVFNRNMHDLTFPSPLF